MPFSASMISYSSCSISFRISRFISESSTISNSGLRDSGVSATSASVITEQLRCLARYIRESARFTASSTEEPLESTPPMLTESFIWS